MSEPTSSICQKIGTFSDCCVPNCSSKTRKNKSQTLHFHSFPKTGTSTVSITNDLGVLEKIDRRKAWIDRLLIKKPVTNSMLVCSLHFKESDYVRKGPILQYMKAPRLKLTAVPSQNLPKPSTTSRWKALSLKTYMMTRHRQKSSLCNKGPSEGQEFPSSSSSKRKNKQSKENTLKDSIVISDNEETESETGTSKPFVFVDINKIKEKASRPVVWKTSPKLPSPKFKHRPIILRKQQANTRPEFQSVYTQTDSPPPPKKTKAVNLAQIIDFLRENLLDQVLKVHENNLRITDCTIRLKNVNNGDEEAGRLIIEPNKFTSVGNILPSSYLTKCVFQSHVESVDNPILSSQNFDCNDIENIHCNVKKIAENKNALLIHNTVKKPTKTPIFGQNVEVALCRLPDSLVSALEKGEKVAVDVQEFHRQGISFRKDTVKLLQRDTIVKAENKTCTICHSTFLTSEDLIGHKCHFGDGETGLLSTENNMTEDVPTGIEQPCIISSSPVSKIHMSTPIKLQQDNQKTENAIMVGPTPLSETLPSKNCFFECDKCSQRYKYKATLDLHKKTRHDRPENENKQKSPLPYAEEVCPECTEVTVSADLDQHLLDVHKIVIKRSIYKCDSCNKIFITFRSMMYHKEKDHNMEVDKNIMVKLRCLNCKKLFEIEYYRKYHMKECIGNKNRKPCDTSTNESLQVSTKGPEDKGLDKSKSIYNHGEALESNQKNKVTDGQITNKLLGMSTKGPEQNTLVKSKPILYSNKALESHQINEATDCDITNGLLQFSTKELEDNTLDSEPLYYHEELLESYQISDITEELDNTRKRKYSSYIENDENKQREVNEEISELFKKVKHLLECSEGPNNITFEEMEE